MPRPYIGPVIDFRIPGEVKSVVEEQARAAGRHVDDLCREIFVAGVASRFGVSSVVRNTPPKVAVGRAELAHDRAQRGLE